MKKQILIYLVAAMSIPVISIHSYAQVVINEFSCSNLSQFVDDHSDYGDWIELFNTTSSSVNIGGYYLSDDSLNLTKWQFPPSAALAGNGFLRIWASGRNQTTGVFHTNFTLKQTKNNGEYVIFSDPSGAIADYRFISPRTQLGHSVGRVTNGSATWVVFTNPTPNASNNTAAPYSGYAKKPNFSVAPGFYPSSISVIITTNEPSADIRYTTDGTLPTASSTLYTGPISITTTKTLKAITISSNSFVLPSMIEFSTYFINVTHTVPVVSITGSQLTTLANGNSSLRPHGTFEYFDLTGARKATTYGEFNSHGQDSWANAHRSLDFVSRDEMGYNHSVEHQLFHTSPRDNYQRVILRAAGDDNYPTNTNWKSTAAHMRDAYLHNLCLSGNMKVDVRRAAKCVAYLNGTFWGVYDLRDNPDDHDNTKYYYGQDKYHLYFLETWGNTWAEYGGPAAFAEYDALVNFIMTNNMAVPSNYQYVYDRLEVESLVDYVLANMFSVCKDWLNWNTGWWRGLDSTGTHLKWGYILWDNDATWGHYINYTGIPNTSASAAPCDVETLHNFGNFYEDSHIEILNKLRTNPDFNQYYIARQIDLWNTTFSCDNMLSQLDSTANVIMPEMNLQISRWGGGTYSQWYNNYQTLRNFIISRCTLLTNGWNTCYSLTGPHTLTVDADPAGAGYVNLNSLTLNNLPWTGQYFSGISTKLGAVANGTYQFVNWTSNAHTFSPAATSPNSTVGLTTGDTIVAHFLTTGVPEFFPLNEPIVSAQPTLFSNSTVINFSLSESSPVSVRLYDMVGNLIMNLDAPGAEVPAGNHQLDLNLSGSSLRGGVYLLDFTAGTHRKSLKLIYAPVK